MHGEKIGQLLVVWGVGLSRREYGRSGEVC